MRFIELIDVDNCKHFINLNHIIKVKETDTGITVLVSANQWNVGIIKSKESYQVFVSRLKQSV